jgi:hypothetical protein
MKCMFQRYSLLFLNYGMAGSFQRHVAGIVGRRSPAGKATSVANQFLRQLESRDWLVEGGVQDKRQIEHRGLSHAAPASADPATVTVTSESNCKTLQCVFALGEEAPVQVPQPLMLILLSPSLSMSSCVAALVLTENQI